MHIILYLELLIEDCECVCVLISLHGPKWDIQSLLEPTLQHTCTDPIH